MKYRRPLSALSLLVACSGTSCEPDTKITVSSTADGGEGSLRAAIAAANRADPTKTVRIEVPTGTYSLGLCGSDDTNDAGDLDLTTLGSVMIVGTGPSVVIKQTCSGERVLDAFGTGTLTLVDVTVSGGSLTELDSTVTARGGGVRAAASVVLQRANITGNQANGATGAPAQGGGLFVGRDLVAARARIESNTATGGAGTPGGDAEGGGAYVVGAITMTSGDVSQNNARGGNARGGGIAQASTSAQTVLHIRDYLRCKQRGGGRKHFVTRTRRGSRRRARGSGCHDSLGRDVLEQSSWWWSHHLRL